MESYITISLLNDFLFCPRSIYFHGLYAHYADDSYKDQPQIAGTLAHARIEDKRYSTRRTILQSLPVFSERYGLAGKIDIYDTASGELIERKNQLKKIYPGQLYQVYAQYFCLEEMGYSVKKIFLHSLVDNRRYPIELPGAAAALELKKLIETIKNFTLTDTGFTQAPAKCQQCIYAELCDTHNS